jgi:hypothetical protein
MRLGLHFDSVLARPLLFELNFLFHPSGSMSRGNRMLEADRRGLFFAILPSPRNLAGKSVALRLLDPSNNADSFCVELQLSR